MAAAAAAQLLGGSIHQDDRWAPFRSLQPGHPGYERDRLRSAFYLQGNRTGRTIAGLDV